MAEAIGLDPLLVDEPESEGFRWLADAKPWVDQSAGAVMIFAVEDHQPTRLQHPAGFGLCFLVIASVLLAPLHRARVTRVQRLAEPVPVGAPVGVVAGLVMVGHAVAVGWRCCGHIKRRVPEWEP